MPTILFIINSSFKKTKPKIIINTVDNCFIILNVEGSSPYLAILIFIFGKHSIREVKSEFNLYDKKRFILAAFCWALMLNTSIRAYQLGSVTIVAPLFALTAILNALVEFIFNHDKSKFVQKIVAAIIILIGVILIKM